MDARGQNGMDRDMNNSVIHKDRYEATGSVCVWTEPHIDPDTGEFFWTIRGEDWDEF